MIKTCCEQMKKYVLDEEIEKRQYRENPSKRYMFVYGAPHGTEFGAMSDWYEITFCPFCGEKI